ncbi:MAG: class I SAM-dependent methyltransferase [Thermodesulfobacteriota bacterium]|nr:class I SAM-dependent methyltransferase [Thermodesulfobacteriota bacterium]
MAHLCSHQHVWTFDNFLRPLLHNPEKLFSSYVKPGMRVMDVGCGAGFAVLGMAKLVGETGKVIAVDVQPEMLAKVEKRKQKAGFQNRIETHLSRADALQVSGPFDFVNAFYMAHEVPDTDHFLREIYECLGPDGAFLIVEPKFHVSKNRFQAMLETARKVGFKESGHPQILFSRAVVLTKSFKRKDDEIVKN